MTAKEEKKELTVEERVAMIEALTAGVSDEDARKMEKMLGKQPGF